MSKFFFFYLILKEKKVGHRTKKYDELSTCISVLLATLWLLMGLMGNEKKRFRWASTDQSELQ